MSNAGRPNILLLLTDDHPQWAMGCYGNRELRTPTFDYLAATGVRMANAFTPTPVCSPARACLHTGRLSSQHGIHDFLMEMSDYQEIRNRDWLAHETTIAQILSQAGYQTGLTGKWHCGRSHVRQPGFDYWFSMDLDRHGHAGPAIFWENGERRDLAGYKTEIITDHAIKFLRSRDRARPLFLCVGYIATHSPWSDHPERLVSGYRQSTFQDIPNDTVYPFGRLADESLVEDRRDRREALAQLYAAVSEIDEQLGRLIDELDAQGLPDDTVMVYTSDHGLNCSHHGIWGKGNGTRPLNMLEESIRVPMIFNCPGGFVEYSEGRFDYRGLFAGQVRSEFVDHCDLFQTLLDCAGVALPQDVVAERRYPGRSFRPLLEGRAIPDWKTEAFGEYGNLRMIRTRTHKLIRRYPDGPHELFDLAADPRETTNLFREPDRQPLIRELTARMEGFYSRHEDPEKTGLRIHELLVHNPREAWRG